MDIFALLFFFTRGEETETTYDDRNLEHCSVATSALVANNGKCRQHASYSNILVHSRPQEGIGNGLDVLGWGITTYKKGICTK